MGTAARRLLSYALALAFLAVALEVAYGGPPPQRPVEPGVVVTSSL